MTTELEQISALEARLAISSKQLQSVEDKLLLLLQEREARNEFCAYLEYGRRGNVLMKFYASGMAMAAVLGLLSVLSAWRPLEAAALLIALICLLQGAVAVITTYYALYRARKALRLMERLAEQLGWRKTNMRVVGFKTSTRSRP